MRKTCHSRGNRILFNRLYPLVIFASLDFFSPKFLTLPDKLSKMIMYVGILLMLVASCGESKGRQQYNGSLNLTKISWLLLFGLTISAFNAYIYKGQEIITSLIANMQSIAYAFLLIFVFYEVEIKTLERWLKVFAILFTAISFISILSPTELFGTTSFDDSRGGIRLRMLGIEWVTMFLLYSVNQYALTQDRKHVRWITICSVCLLASLTRQVIVISFGLAILLWFHKAAWLKKMFFGVLLFGLMTYVIPHVPVANKMIEKTLEEKAAQSQYDNIRIVAFNYFVFEYPRNTQQKLFGIGVPAFGKSKYGNEYEQTTNLMRVYREDVGYAGFYFNYGLIPLLLVMTLMVVPLFYKSPPRLLYAKYYLVSVMLLSIASQPITSNSAIITTMVAIYILYVKQETECTNKTNVKISNNHTGI